ncbi:helix-turn-helix domain-containing protein [Roseivirga pacifica]|uniref:helix-turn-helix domain-containing protein n=1 Tax=Roseivirga pacifica TaxID=1267423 RepID=UPI00227BBC3A|nr:helix-turn-helix domain-containing protein [Roseivirga pacifica]|tara:strand:+ start:130 stop:390 length:261 start_codon:yes stop_codon:yes gene_type:complete
MNVICLEEQAFYELIEQVVERLSSNHNKPPEKWIDGEEAMRMLNITSPSTLQKYRNEGKIRFSQPNKRFILYDRESINQFIEKNTK